MNKLIAFCVLALMSMIFTAAPQAQAQQNDQSAVWIQVAAHPSLSQAQERATGFAATLPDVAGFSLGGGWYGVVLGPYSRQDAERILQVYRAERRIPNDSFIAFSGNLRSQFYPIGQISQTPLEAPITSATAEPTAEPVEIQSILPDETPAQARRSEQALTRDERKQLQIALKSMGFYNSSIDGAFGRGTRRSMEDWQAVKGYNPTGVLTTAQRAQLMDEYNAPLISVGMARVADAQAGIALQLPTREVAFERYESPFAQYSATGDLGARVLLISQPGDKRTLYGLYEIMQTLKVIPLDGERKRGANSFTIEGRGNGIVSYTEASLKNGEIKGFTLVWPAGDEERRSRVLTTMQSSFTRIDGILDPAAGADAPQNVDLLAGMRIRKPRISRSGFFVDEVGTVVTTTDAVQGCTRVTLDHDYTAEVLVDDAANGLAIVQPAQSLAPMAIATFTETAPRIQSDVAVSGFSYEGVLGAPSLTWGTLSDVKSLNGDVGVARLALSAQSGDAGGPIIDTSGAVVGMLLPQQIGSQQLPAGVSFAANADAIRLVLRQANLRATPHAPSGASLPNAALTREANGMTVLVSCWD